MTRNKLSEQLASKVLYKDVYEAKNEELLAMAKV